MSHSCSGEFIFTFSPLFSVAFEIFLPAIAIVYVVCETLVPATGIVGVGGEVQIGDVDKILVVGEGSRSAGGGGAVSVEGLLNQVAINGVGGELVVVAEGAATVPTETVEREEVVGVVNS